MMRKWKVLLEKYVMKTTLLKEIKTKSEKKTI